MRRRARGCCCLGVLVLMVAAAVLAPRLGDIAVQIAGTLQPGAHR